MVHGTNKNGDMVIPKEAWTKMMGMMALTGQRLMSLLFPSVNLSIEGQQIPDDVRIELMTTGLQAAVIANMGMLPTGGEKLEPWEYDMFVNSVLKEYVLAIRTHDPEGAKELIVTERDRIVDEVMRYGEDEAHELATKRAIKANTGIGPIDELLQGLTQANKGQKARIDPKSVRVIPIRGGSEEAERLERYIREQMAKKGDNFSVEDLIGADLNEITKQEEESPTASEEHDRKADDVRDLLNSPEYLAMLEEDQ